MFGTNCTAPPGVQAAALRKAFPAYAVKVSTWRDAPHYELVTREDGNPWCLISDDVQEIWDELADSPPTSDGPMADA